MKAIVIDALARGKGKRMIIVDVIGIGPRAVVGILEQIGVSADIYPAELVFQDPTILGKYDLMLVSAMSTDAPVSRTLVKLWQKYSEGYTILGGPITADKTMVRDLGFDLGVYGEAEETLPSLIKIIDESNININKKEFIENVRKVRGVIIPFGKSIIFTGKPSYVPRDKLNYVQSTRIENYPIYWASRVYVEVVRGCSNFKRPTLEIKGGKRCIKCPVCFDPRVPLRARLKCPMGIPAGCGYCSVPEHYGPARSRSIRVIVREVKELVRRGVTKIVLSAPDFLDYGRDLLVDPEPLTDPCTPKPNLKAIIDLFENLLAEVPEFDTHDAFLMIENIKACLVDESVARVLGRYLKDTPVHIGAESGDDDLLRKLGRPSLTSDVARAVRLLAENSLEPYVYFIYALPGETEDSAIKTIEFMRKLVELGAVKINIYKFMPLPGTAFENARTVVKEYDKRLKMEAIRLNTTLKTRLLGREVLAIVAGFHKAKSMLVAYPLPHGPNIYLNGSRELIGWIVKAKIVGVESDRAVYGIVLKLIKKIKP